ncbi:DNA/RNA polymerase [Lophiostoma macrostomum CBS 122681]|uniref:DNA/RNA polymerase n=1 Tax=Lophiostoma macrostomum CBS 122681 TaxID=1314788 RepID=A0A6A6T765_9PLEO|nr:DNA/RNA polymerase [Lophiostoma macrostomum CBS 122681]
MYDCFYASVFENENPELRAVPLAVQQKQIIVTCNYEARRRGLHKLQLIREAKKICPEVVIVLGEDLTRFRNASKELYAFLRSFSWNSKVERLGFDEVSCDMRSVVIDPNVSQSPLLLFLPETSFPLPFSATYYIIDHNVGLLNANDFTNSYFCLSKSDPTAGFAFNASQLAGHAYPEESNDISGALQLDPLRLRLHLTSHLAQHLREALHSEKGYTCTVGVSTNKLLSKLVGNLHKPNSQTTLLPPYGFETEEPDNATLFVDDHEVGKIPGIGFKLAQKLRAHVLQRPAEFDDGLVYGGTKEKVLVRDVRTFPGMSAETLEQVLGGTGVPHGIGARVWGLLNAYDDTAISQARDVPKQISIEDSYIRLDTMEEVLKELRMLSLSLLKRMHADLLEDEEDEDKAETLPINGTRKRWLAYPKVVRLSTRPRPPQNPDGSRNRSFARISRSAPMPNFVFNLKENVDIRCERLVTEALIPLFRKLHPEKSGWNLSLVNVAAANMVDAASDKGGVGRDIAKMFKRQDDVLKQWRVDDEDDTLSVETGVIDKQLPQDAIAQDTVAMDVSKPDKDRTGSEDFPTTSQQSTGDTGDWESEDEDMLDDDMFRCECGAVMPVFAMAAHGRWHEQN